MLAADELYPNNLDKLRAPRTPVGRPAADEHVGGAAERPRDSLRSATDGIADQIRKTRLLIFDFDGVFTDNRVHVNQEGTESVSCWRGDGLGLNRLRRLGIDMAIVSTEANPVVAARARKQGIRCIQGVDDKLAELRRIAEESALSLDQLAFVGNDINDLPALQAVALPIVVQDSHPDVLPHGVYRTQAPGGQGAVREVCDLFIDAIAVVLGDDVILVERPPRHPCNEALPDPGVTSRS